MWTVTPRFPPYLILKIQSRRLLIRELPKKLVEAHFLCFFLFHNIYIVDENYRNIKGLEPKNKRKSQNSYEKGMLGKRLSYKELTKKLPPPTEGGRL